MKAIVATRFGTPPEMALEERPKPAFREGHSLVRMHSATINQLSNTIRKGGHPLAKAPLVLGNEGAGAIEESRRFTPGTRIAIYGSGVLGITEDGLFQQWVLVEDKRIVVLPDSLSFEEGAALTVNYLTAYRSLTHAVTVKPGQTLLVSGATGSVGHALLQVARALGCEAIALVSTADKTDRARKAGASGVIDLSSQDAVAAVRELTDGTGADLAFDPVGGPIFGQMLRAIRGQGTMISIGFTAGNEPSLDLFDLIAGQKRVAGYSLHAEADEDLVAPLQQVVTLAARGALKPVIDTAVGLENFEDGYARLASRKAAGSIVLRL